MQANAAATDRNKVRSEDRAVHEWYRFVLSFPPHLVQTYLQRFEAGSGDTVLDPFCGTGTTLVECKKSGVPSVGIESNPMAGLEDVGGGIESATIVELNLAPALLSLFLKTD